MLKSRKIEVFEHQRLYVGENGFSQSDLDTLLSLHEKSEGRFFEPISKGIKFNQYVGVIQVNGLILEIHPKADKNDDDSRWKGVLISMLKACGKLKVKSTGDALVKKQHLNLLELYFELYLNEVNHIVRLGLIKQYRKETKNISALKGKLEFAGNIRQNIVRKDRFYTTHQVYDQDHKLHQVLWKALDIVEQFSRGTRINDFASRVKLDFPDVEQINVTESILDSIKINRKSKPYEYALELARLIILNYSPDISAGKEKMLSLLFNMNELWEEFVLKQLKKVSFKYNIEVTGQESKRFWGYNSIRPDIVVKKGEETFIIDTKWKTPWNKSASIEDLRQMYAYGRFWSAKKMMLLYPGDLNQNDFKPYLNQNTDGIDHQCKLGFINVFDEEGRLDLHIGHKVFCLLD